MGARRGADGRVPGAYAPGGQEDKLSLVYLAWPSTGGRGSKRSSRSKTPVLAHWAQ